MSCKCAKYDAEDGRYLCSVSGDNCMYLIPNSEKCAKDYGEGPDVEELVRLAYIKSDNK